MSDFERPVIPEIIKVIFHIIFLLFQLFYFCIEILGLFVLFWCQDCVSYLVTFPLQ